MYEMFEESYFQWLLDRSYPKENIGSYDLLFELLYSVEYIPVHHMDENRRVDGLCLRDDWMRIFDIDMSQEWLDQPCSILELLVGMSMRCEFQSSHINENQ